MNNSLLSRFDTHIAMCSALGVAATMAAPQQEAEAVDYVYYQPNGGAGWVVPSNLNGLYVNVETQVTGASFGAVPGWDVNIYTQTQSSTISFFRTSANGTFYMKYAGGDPNNSVGNQDLGTTVGASSSFTTSPVNTASFGPGNGQWKVNSPNYFGFSFIGADAGTHYGWMRLDVGADYSVRTIMEVGYSSVIGQSVTVGAQVPEPSTVIMGVLASGATGVIAWRRRRKTA